MYRCRQAGRPRICIDGGRPRICIDGGRQVGLEYV